MAHVRVCGGAGWATAPLLRRSGYRRRLKRGIRRLKSIQVESVVEKRTRMEINLITFNVFADLARTRPLSVWQEHVPVWKERKAFCVQALHQAQPSIIGLQEVLPHQFHFLQSHLPGFRAITVTDTTT